MTAKAAEFRCAVLIVSDTVAQNAATDQIIPILRSLFDQHPSFSLVATHVVADDQSDIHAKVAEWSASKINLILTSGGTGFSPRDVTPEAVAPLLSKDSPGLTHLMLSRSLDITPLAALARPKCGITATGSIVVTLPGSPKGAKENLEALMPLLSHALKLARGDSSRALHAHSHPHTHTHTDSHAHHGHHGPQAHTKRAHNPAEGPSRRHRSSPYPIVPMSDALALIFAQAQELGVIEASVLSDSLVGHVLAEDVVAGFDIPRTRTTNVDGYALRSSLGQGVFPVQTARTAPLPYSVSAAEVYRVNTGGPLPDDADAVIMVEDTEVVETRDGNAEEKTIKLLAQVKTGENVRQPGSDVKRDHAVLHRGTMLSKTGGEIGTLNFVGREKIKLLRKPIVAIMSTGNEIVDVGTSSTGHAMFDTNRPSLKAALASHHFMVLDLGIVSDNVESTVETILNGADKADVIVVTGGTSMGEADLIKPIIEQQLVGAIQFGRVAMKPGLPTTFATFDHKGQRKLIFSLPGNPASALVTLNLFVLPCLRKMSGFAEARWQLPRLKAEIDSPLPLDYGRPEFHRVYIRPVDRTPYLLASSTGGQRSSKASSLALANGYACLPAGKDGGKAPQPGDIVDVILTGDM